jgi:hypothetical protein
MLFHRWYMFNAVRRDVGEFRYFMAQPFAITLEDFVQWCWRQSVSDPSRNRMWPLAKTVGYVWTIAWFSYCLPNFALGLHRVGIHAADSGGKMMLELGQYNAITWLR